MNIAEIRSKFPQYKDLSDDDLLIGIHRKFYSDLPLQTFLKSVEYTKPDPTEGMSGLDKFRAGAGKALSDVTMGLGQMVGAVSRADVERTRNEDAPLMRTGAGVAGNLIGNLGTMAGTALIPGAATLPGAALIGAATGLAQPSTSTKETFGNMALGGVTAPAAILAGRGIRAGYEGGKALIEPLTRSGQERIAASILQASATDPARAAANANRARSLVPGSTPTLAQAADDPGLAQLERTILNNPEYAPALQQRFADQRAARLGTVNTIAGNVGGHYDAIKQGRDVFAKMDYDQAMRQGIDPKMAEALQPQLESLLRRPSIERAKNVAQRLAAENDETLTDFGSLKGLDWLKKALDNEISKASQPGSSIGKAELRGLVQTKDDLMKTLEQIAPGYATANANYAAMSRQVNSMDVGRSLFNQLQRPGSEYMGNSAKEMGRQYANALSKAQDSVKQATGMNKSIGDVMSTSDISALENVARDYGRKAFAEEAGRAGGSPTAQNLISQNMLRRMIGPAGLPESWAESTMLQTLLSPVQVAGQLGGAQRRILDRVATGLLDPVDAAGLLTMQNTAMQSGRGLLSQNIERLTPPVSLGLLYSSLGAQ